MSAMEGPETAGSVLFLKHKKSAKEKVLIESGEQVPNGTVRARLAMTVNRPTINGVSVTKRQHQRPLRSKSVVVLFR